MVDQLQVDMIVRAISEGFDKMSKDVGMVGQAYDKSGKLIVDASGKVQSVTKSTTDAVVKGTRAQEQAYERMANKMAFQSNMIAQKYAEQQRQAEALASASAKLAAGYAAVAVAGGVLLGSSIKLAARVETLGVVTVQLGKNVGLTEQQVRSLEKAVMDQGITMQAARQSIARMVQGNIDLAHATDLARLAQDAAVIAGINSSEAFERLTTAIATGQLRMLRTLGIMGTFERSYKELADQLGKTTEELTELEKVQARTNMVIEAGANISGAYESAMETAGKKITSLDRHLEESSRMLGEIWLPAYADVIDILTDSLKVWENLDDELKNNISSFLGVVTITSAVMATLLGVVSVSYKVVVGFKAMTAGVALFGTSLTVVTGGLTILIGLLVAAATYSYQQAKALEYVVDGLNDVEKELRLGEDNYNTYAASVKKAVDATDLMIDAEGNLVRVIMTAGGETYFLVQENYLLSESEREAAKAATDLAHDLEMLDAKTAGLSGVTVKTAEAIEGLNEAAEREHRRMRILADNLGDAEKATEALRMEQLLLRDAVDELAAGLQGTLLKAQDQYIASMDKLKNQQSELITEKEKLLKQGYDPEGEKIQEINEALGENVEAQREARTAIEETTAQMIYQQVAADLDTQAAIGLAQAMGLLSEQDAMVAKIANEATIAFDANENSLIDAGAEAEKYTSFMVKLNDVVANLIASGVDVTFENVAAAMAVASEKGDAVAGILPDVAGGFDDVEVAAGDGVGKAEELFNVIAGDSVDAMIKAGEVETAVEELGIAAVEAKSPFTDLWDHIESGSGLAIEDVNAIQTAVDNLHGKDVIINIVTKGNIPQDFQHGGEMLPGMLGLVGEAGPELFVAPAKGTIIPHSQSTTFLAGLNKQAGTQVVGVDSDTSISKDTYQDIFIEGDTFMVGDGNLDAVQAVATTYKRERLANFVRQ